MKSKIELISQTTTQDAIGQLISTETARKIIGNISSVTLNEITGASQIGATAEYQLRILAKEYNNEQYVIINNKRFHVYRSYLDDRYIELYLEEITTV